MHRRVREQVDDAHARDDEAEADHRRRVQCLAEPQPADRRDEDDPDTGPQRIRDANGEVMAGTRGNPLSA